jgi:hypothetical protein
LATRSAGLYDIRVARKTLHPVDRPPPSAQKTLTNGRAQTIVDDSDDAEHVDDSGEQEAIVGRDEDTPRPTKHTNSMPTVVGAAAGSLLTRALRLLSGDLGRLAKGGALAGGGGVLAALLMTLEGSPSPEEWATVKAQLESSSAALAAHTQTHEAEREAQADLHTSTTKRIDALELGAIQADARTHANEYRSVVEIRLVIDRLDQLADKQGIAASDRKQLPAEIVDLHSDIEAEHAAREREKARLDAFKIEEAMRARGTLPPP